MESKDKPCRLGRRPVTQGPRPLLGNQDRVGKSATGRTATERQQKRAAGTAAAAETGRAGTTAKTIAEGINGSIDTTAVQLRKRLRVGTWNIRSMLQLGKTHVLGREMERLRMDICGLAEVRWGGRGHFITTEGHMIVYSGEENQGHGGVGVWIHKRNTTAIVGYETVNSRILVIRVKAKPKCISLIQVYAPTADKEEDEIEEFYQKLEGTVKKHSEKRHYITNGGFQR